MTGTYIIYVKEADPAGAAISTIEVEVRAADDIEVVKRKVEEQRGVPASEQRIIFAGKQLEAGRALGRYGIQRESTLHMVRRAN